MLAVAACEAAPQKEATHFPQASHVSRSREISQLLDQELARQLSGDSSEGLLSEARIRGEAKL